MTSPVATAAVPALASSASSAPAVIFRHAVRVYWEDTDAGGVVFYANYLKFFERARTEWLRHLGLGQQALRERTGAIFVVTDTQLRYHRPARLDDLLQITVALRQTGAASMRIHQEAWRSDGTQQVLLTEGDIRIGCVDHAGLRPMRIPIEVTELLS
jgi:acyl-CoA thioester hydrolase